MTIDVQHFTAQLVIDKMTALMQEQPNGRYLSAPETWNELLAWLRTVAASEPSR